MACTFQNLSDPRFKWWKDRWDLSCIKFQLNNFTRQFSLWHLSLRLLWWVGRVLAWVDRYETKKVFVVVAVVMGQPRTINDWKSKATICPWKPIQSLATSTSVLNDSSVKEKSLLKQRKEPICVEQQKKIFFLGIGWSQIREELRMLVGPWPDSKTVLILRKEKKSLNWSKGSNKSWVNKDIFNKFTVNQEISQRTRTWTKK